MHVYFFMYRLQNYFLYFGPTYGYFLFTLQCTEPKLLDMNCAFRYAVPNWICCIFGANFWSSNTAVVMPLNLDIVMSFDQSIIVQQNNRLGLQLSWCDN